MMKLSEERVTRLGFWITMVGALFAIAPALYPGYWLALEGFTPVFNARQPGILASIATQPDLWRGTGRATFLLAQPLLLLGASPTAAVRLIFVMALLLGGLGCYAWLRPRLGDRPAGLAALVYLTYPPLLATIYLRGNLADALLIGLLPMTLAGLAGYVESRSPTAAAITVFSLLWMWRIQAGLAVWATLLLLSYALLVERSRMASLVVAATGAAGFASIVPLWQFHAPPPVEFPEHFVYFSQLLYGGWQIAPSVPGWQDHYPFQLGFAAIILSLVVLWLWRVRPIDQRVAERGTTLNRLLRFGFGGTVVLVVLSLPISALFWRITGLDRLLTYPWQLLLLAAPLLATTAGSLPMLSPSLRRAPVWIALAGAVLLAGYPMLTTEHTQLRPPDTPVAVFGQQPSLLLLQADLSTMPPSTGSTDNTIDSGLIESELTDNEAGSASSAEETLSVATLDVTWQVVRPLEFDYNIFFQAVTQTPEGERVLAQLDIQPRQGEEPATSWMPGQILTDTYRLAIPAQPDGGEAQTQEPGSSEPDSTDEIRYYFGYYDWRDNSRLPVDGGIDDKLILYGN